MPAGRPSDYDPSYCEKVIEWGKLGKSKVWMCAQLDICKRTMQRWEDAHPEFSAALTRAAAHAQAHWEDLGQHNIKDRDFNSSVWSRSMAARFPDDWREKNDVNMNGTLQVSEVKRTIVDSGNPDA
jgi:hypothetical protein